MNKDQQPCDFHKQEGYFDKKCCHCNTLLLDKDKSCRCNNCMNIYHEDILECPKCKTDAYLMQPYEDIKNPIKEYSYIKFSEANIKELKQFEGKYSFTYIMAAINAYSKNNNMIRDLKQSLKDLTDEIKLSKLNIRKDFSLINAHNQALKALQKAES